MLRKIIRSPILNTYTRHQQRNLQGLVVGIPKESLEGEHRVALTPVNVTKLVKAGATVKIESGAGMGSGFADEQYKAAGALLVDGNEAWKSELVAKVFSNRNTRQIYANYKSKDS